jgi:hypothetical protein
MRFRFLGLLSLCLMGGVPALGESVVDSLDRATIQTQYSDGEFDAVVQQLESFRQSHPQCRRNDSLIYAKFLGVIYTANPSTREKGKYWFYKLVQIDPNAELVDLYVSEDIQSVFERVRREVVVRRRYQGINDKELDHAMRGDGTKDTVVLRDTVVIKNAGLSGTLIGLATSLETPAPVFAGKEKENKLGWTFDFNFLVGLKLMDASAWQPVQNQYAFQGVFDFRRISWPVNLTIDFTQTMTKDIAQYNSLGEWENNQGFTQELYFGLRKFWDIRLLALRPFAEMGLGMAAVTFISDGLDEYPNNEFKQTGYGAWLGGGVFYEMERHFNFGGRLWHSWAEINHPTGFANAGGTSFGLMAGFHY